MTARVGLTVVEVPSSVVPGLDLTAPQGLLALVVFGILFVAILLAAFGVGGSTRQRRLAQVERYRLATARSGPRSQSPAGPVVGRTLYLRSLRSLRTWLALACVLLFGPLFGVLVWKLLAGVGRTDGADGPSRWPDVKTIELAAIAVGALLFGLLFGWVAFVLGTLLGVLITILLPRVRESRRRQAFADGLPDALQLIVGSLRSGFSLGQALDAVVRDSPPGPLTVELGRAIGEVRLGDDLADALDRAAARVENDDLAWAVTAIRIQRDTGGNLAEILETTVDTLRERGRLRRQVRALSAEGRLSGYILVGLPFALAGWLLLVRREYLSALWTTRIGLMMTLYAIVSMTVGIVWMMRWIKVEV